MKSIEATIEKTIQKALDNNWEIRQRDGRTFDLLAPPWQFKTVTVTPNHISFRSFFKAKRVRGDFGLQYEAVMMAFNRQESGKTKEEESKIQDWLLKDWK